jgi:hypothetical protein
MYEIRENATYGSREIYFEGKPSEAVRNALKSLKMRWNPTKKCWYGFAPEYQMISAINEAGETVYTDGYLGGGAVYGAKSGQHLYGAELSKAIRAELKAAGIKGASVSCQTYSGGQHLYVKLNTTESDFVSLEEYTANYRVKAGWGWIWTGEESVHVDTYYSMEAEQQEATRVLAAKAAYQKALSGQDINHYHMDNYTEFSEGFKAKMEKVQAIIEMYRYDNSNSMVDYFDTNFYYTIETKAVQGA